MYLHDRINTLSFFFSPHPVIEADKDPTQSLVCKVPDEMLSVAQIPEEKASLSSKDATVETASTEVPSKPAQPEAAQDEAACAKPTIDSENVITCETSAEVPLPKPPVEATEQCQLSSPQTTQETTLSQGENLLLVTKEQPDSQTSACLLACAVCKTADVSVAQTDSEPSTLTDSAKSEISISAAPISADSPQSIVAPPAIEQAPIENTAERTIDVTQPLTIDPSERHAEVLLAASEVSTVSPVPIQVAESVLQAEPKESVSGATVNASDQAISTTITAVHEFTDVVQPTAECVQLNGSVCEAERPSDVAPVAAALFSLPEKTNTPAEPTKEPPSDSATRTDVPSEASSAEVEKLTKPTEQIAKAETAEVEEPSEQLAKAEETEKISAETVAKPETVAEEASSKVSESPITEQSPPKEKPAETKTSIIPSTPTVIEATPPTSPSAESAQETEEKIGGERKKSLKKSDSADGADGEGADKKKKTVKKVVKKPKAKPEEAASTPTGADGAVADGSPSKTKKTVKVVKKTTTKTLETDASVPETPPPPSPASADAPVPPKRKTKNSSTASAKGTTSKKTEAEE